MNIRREMGYFVKSGGEKIFEIMGLDLLRDDKLQNMVVSGIDD